MESKNFSLGKTILLLIAVAVYIIVFIGIYSILGVKEVWLGFLLLWYWGMEKHASFESVIKTILPGALVGLLLTYVIHVIPSLLGTIGILMASVIVVFMVLSTFKGWLKMFINGATFLCLTVFSIPALANTVNYLDYLWAIVLACAYIGISAWLMKKLSKTKDKTEEISETTEKSCE